MDQGRMKWKDLLCEDTLTERKVPNGYKFLNNYARGSFETDYDLIVSSSAFRRLQDKTQVFPLDQSDFVRTRLTHSIEASSIAKQLGVMVTNGKKEKNDKKNFEEESEETKRNIPTVLSCAGLIHDLGNPPFGHFGEDVIRDWFLTDKELHPYKDRQKEVHIKKELTEEQYKDLCNFEGNAQAIRILSKTKYEPEGNDLNLTFAVINTLMKYTEDSLHFDKNDKDVKKHKLGYYQAEKDIVDQVCTATTTKREDGYCRHPLTFLLEAADDIAYATSDLEDTVKKGLLPVKEFEEYFENEVEKYSQEINEKESKLDKSEGLINDEEMQEYREIIVYERRCIKKSTALIKYLIDQLNGVKDRETKMALFQKWIGLARQCLMYVVAFSFSDNYNEIMKGNYEQDMFEDGLHKYTIKILKNAVHKYAHTSTGIVELELSSKKIISSLLDDFVGAVIDWPEDGNKPTKEHEKLQIILSESLKKDYESYINNPDHELTSQEKLYRRLLMVTDFISGMTDSYALNLYKKLNGSR